MEMAWDFYVERFAIKIDWIVFVGFVWFVVCRLSVFVGFQFKPCSKIETLFFFLFVAIIASTHP